MALTEKAIREKICENLVTLFPDAKILVRNPYTHPRDQWVGAFNHEYPADSGEIVTHAWFVRRYMVDPAIGHRDDLFGYQIMAGMGMSYGTSVANSEDVFQENLDTLSEALKDEQAFFDFTGEADSVGVDQLFWEGIGIIDSSEMLHFATGRVLLRIFRC